MSVYQTHVWSSMIIVVGLPFGPHLVVSCNHGIFSSLELFIFSSWLSSMYLYIYKVYPKWLLRHDGDLLYQSPNMHTGACTHTYWKMKGSSSYLSLMKFRLSLFLSILNPNRRTCPHSQHSKLYIPSWELFFLCGAKQSAKNDEFTCTINTTRVWWVWSHHKPILVYIVQWLNAIDHRIEPIVIVNNREAWTR